MAEIINNASAIEKAVKIFNTGKLEAGNSTPGELINEASGLKIRFSDIVIAESLVQKKWSIQDFCEEILKSFNHYLKALELGLGEGRSFLLGSVGSDLYKKGLDNGAILNDTFVNRAIVYTLATEVGNHQIGLQPAAGTGDSCPYTGLLRALLETEKEKEKIIRGMAVLLKVSTVFRAGKTTTGCNMEGYGAGACATAACITEINDGSPGQVEKAMVLALSPTIAVPCTPRVMIPGLCANHIASAITTGNNAARIVLNSNMEVNVDIDAMVSMAAEIHKKAAPVITEINLKWLGPYFNKNSEVDKWIDPEVLNEEQHQINAVKKNSLKYMKEIIKNSPAIDCPFGDIVVGGSSMAVGSPTNMGRIIHEIIEGEISSIRIELTSDLFVRRAINVPGILMGAILGAKTDDIKAYKEIIGYVKRKKIIINIKKIKEPEIQRIYVKTDIGEYMLDSRNRGGGRVTIIDAIPSREKAVEAANKLGIVIPRS